MTSSNIHSIIDLVSSSEDEEANNSHIVHDEEITTRHTRRRSSRRRRGCQNQRHSPVSYNVEYSNFNGNENQPVIVIEDSHPTNEVQISSSSISSSSESSISSLIPLSSSIRSTMDLTHMDTSSSETSLTRSNSSNLSNARNIPDIQYLHTTPSINLTSSMLPSLYTLPTYNGSHAGPIRRRRRHDFSDALQMPFTSLLHHHHHHPYSQSYNESFDDYLAPILNLRYIVSQNGPTTSPSTNGLFTAENLFDYHQFETDLPQNGATREMINRLPRRKLGKEVNGKEKDCCICLDSMKMNQTIRILPCQHEFHIKCIDNWLKRKKSCPLDKKNIDEQQESSLSINSTSRNRTSSTRRNRTTSRRNP